MGTLRNLLRTRWIAYAGIHVHANTVAQSIANGANYVKVINFTDNDPSLNCTPDATNNKIIVNSDGIYKIDGSFSFTASNNKTAFGAIFLDGAEAESIHFTRKIGVAGDVGSAGFTGLITILSGQELDLRARHDDALPEDFTFSYMNFNCNKLDRLD
jgi:hypothetical protein